MDDDFDLSAAPDPSAELVEVAPPDSPDDHDAPLDAADDGFIDLPGDDEPDEPVVTTAVSAEDDAALRAEAEDLRRNLAQLQQERNRERAQLARLAEENQLRDIESRYEQGLAAVKREAANQPDPEDFIFRWGREWAEWRLHQREALTQQRLQQAQQAYTRASIPNYAQKVAQAHGLTADEAQDLLDYHPNQMVAEAKKMVRNRTKSESEIAALKKQLDQIKREVAAHNAAPAAVTPGTGRGPTRRVKAGSDAHLRAIFQAATG